MADVVTVPSVDAAAGPCVASEPAVASAAAPARLQCIKLHFEDGPEVGFLSAVTDEDWCQPRYWCFNELHGCKPTAKVLFGDGGFLYFAKWPTEPAGTLIDEDCDEHRYEAAQPTQAWPPDCDAEFDALLQPSSKRRRRVVSDDEDSGGNAADDLKAPARSAQDAPSLQATASSGDVGAGESGKCAVWSVQGVGSACAVGESLIQGMRPASDVGATPAGQSPSATEASASTVGWAVARKVSEPGAGPEIRGAASGVVGAHVEPSEQSARHEIVVEQAKTGKSRCKTCNEPILQGTWRCGMQCYSGGHLSMFWAHASCFLAKMSVEYSPAKRGRCYGSGEPFEKGDLRVSLEIGGQRKWFRPGAAARYTAQLLGKDGIPSLGPIAGFDDLEPGHGELLLAVFSGKAAASAAAALSRASTQRKRGVTKRPSDPAAMAPAPEAPNQAPAGGEAAEVTQPKAPRVHRDLSSDSDSDVVAESVQSRAGASARGLASCSPAHLDNAAVGL